MRTDMLKHHIKVTNIAPGMVETEFSIVRYKGDKEAADTVYQGMTPLTRCRPEIDIRVGARLKKVKGLTFYFLSTSLELAWAEVYQGMTPLTNEDIAETIIFAITRPAHVCLNDIVIMPTAQANSRDVDRSKRLSLYFF